MGALFRGSSRIVGVRAVGELVVAAGHGDGLASLQIVDREVHSASPVVARALGGIGDITMLVGRRRIPEDLRDVPRPVTVEDQQTTTLFVKVAIGAGQRLGGWALEESKRLGIDRRAKEVVAGCVVDVQLECRVELDQVYQIRLRKSPCSTGGCAFTAS